MMILAYSFFSMVLCLALFNNIAQLYSQLRLGLSDTMVIFCILGYFLYIYIDYIYIYMCVCVCECVFKSYIYELICVILVMQF